MQHTGYTYNTFIGVSISYDFFHRWRQSQTNFPLVSDPKRTSAILIYDFFSYDYSADFSTTQDFLGK